MPTFEQLLPLLNTIVIGGFILSGVAILKTPLSKLIESITNIVYKKKKGEDSTLISMRAEPSPISPPEVDRSTSSEGKAIALVEQDLTPTEDKKAEDQEFTIYQLIRDGKKNDAEQLYKDKLSKSENPEQAFLLKHLYAYFSFHYGQEKAGDSLLRLLSEYNNDETKLVQVLSSYTSVLISTARHVEAISILEDYAQRVSAESAKIRIMATLSDVFKITKGPIEAANYLYSQLSLFSDKSCKYALFRQLYELLKDIDKKSAFLAINMAVFLDPSNKDDLFTAAYNGQHNLLKLYLYSRLKEIEPDKPYSINNFGVSLMQFGLKATGVAMYQRASKLGNTLSMANTADLLLDAGFALEAKEILEAALKMPDPHKSVYTTFARIGEAGDQESKKQKLLLAEGEKMFLYLSKHTDLFFTPVSAEELIGTYVSPDSASLTIELISDDLFLLRNTRSGSVYERKAFINFRGTEITMNQKFGEYESTSKVDVYLFFENPNVIRLADIKEETTVSETLYTRVEVEKG